MVFSGSFNVASDGFLAATPLSLHPLPSLISSYSNMPFVTQVRSWNLRSVPYKQENGVQKGFHVQEPHRVQLGFTRVKGLFHL